VSDVHTFAVGEGQWVVHNCDLINVGQQAKHLPGDPGFIPGRSELTYADPQELLARGSGNGQPIRGVFDQPGYKERFDFGEVIGVYVQGGIRIPSTIGIIAHGSRGAHIYPGRPL
jgi:filamentous hemagglutinin